MLLFRLPVPFSWCQVPDLRFQAVFEGAKIKYLQTNSFNVFSRPFQTVDRRPRGRRGRPRPADRGRGLPAPPPPIGRRSAPLPFQVGREIIQIYSAN